MRRAVDPPREAGDHVDPLPGETPGQAPGGLEPRTRRTAGPDHRHAPLQDEAIAPDEQEDRRVGDLPEERRVVVVQEADQPGAAGFQAADLVVDAHHPAGLQERQHRLGRFPGNLEGLGRR